MIRLTTAAFLIIASPSLLAADGVGKVLLSFGKNHAITAEGELRLLKRKSEIFNQETLQTGPRGRLQVRFSDDSMLSLKPNTRYAIQQYEFNKAAPTESKAFYKLIKGGMRTISGKIGKVDREDYKLETVVATIGIRGTEFEVLQNAEGMWLGVSDGKVFAESDQTSELIGSGGYAFVGNNGQLIVLDERPAELDQSTATSDSAEDEEQGGSGGGEQEGEEDTSDDGAAEGAAETADDSGETETGSGNETDLFNDDSVAEVTQSAGEASNTASDPGQQSQQGSEDAVAEAQEETQTSADSTDNATSNDTDNNTDTGTGSQAGTSVNADAGSRVRMVTFAQGNTSNATGLVVTAESGQKKLKVDKDNKLFTGYDLKQGNGFLSGSTGSSCAPSNSCTLTLSGKTSDGTFGTDGDIYYGRWNQNALSSASENGSSVSIAAPLHYVFSEKFSGTAVVTELNKNKTGSVRYDLSSATKPTSLDSSGNLLEGTLNSAKIILNYDDMKVLDAAMAISMDDGRKLDMSLLSEMSLNASGEFVAMSMSGHCSGGFCTDSDADLTQVSMNGTWAFDLVGDKAQQLMSEYIYNSSSSQVTPFSVNGVAVLDQSPKEGFAVAYIDNAASAASSSAATTSASTSLGTHLKGENGAAVVDYKNLKLTTVDVSGADVITSLSVTDTDEDDGCNPCTFDSDGLSGSEGTAALKDSGFAQLDEAKVSWGRWNLTSSGANLSITDGTRSGTVDARGPLHFVYSGDLTPYDTIAARSGTATYSWSNGTAPTLSDSTVTGLDGTVNKLDVSVSFETQNVTAVDMGLSFSNGSSAYSVNANLASDAQTGLQNLVSGSDDLRLHGSVNRTLSASTPENIQMEGRMTLQFVGEQGQGAITSFGLQEQGSVSGVAVSGAGLLKEAK
ncbi:FecR family protein [Marinobacterium jannaschii]|uniref:FecR family protein n=1 Tax=Marinobacterium jannaschii TaxID=64970 RepID=UPI00068438CA|nr:FecR family protein [Marinobacterium jannaschii]